MCKNKCTKKIFNNPTACPKEFPRIQRRLFVEAPENLNMAKEKPNESTPTYTKQYHYNLGPDIKRFDICIQDRTFVQNNIGKLNTCYIQNNIPWYNRLKKKRRKKKK